MISFENKHAGETCIIIGNGPSLRDVPDEFLDKYPTFGANRIYLRYTPTYFVCVNPLVLKQNADDIKVLDCDKFVRDEYADRVGGHGLISVGRKTFSYNPGAYVYEGYTVTFVSLQLAYYMGFEAVLLVGVDHRYEYQGKPNEQRTMEDDDPNHFDPNYFKGQAWNNPDLAKSEEAYRMAEKAYRENGRRVVNLTHNSALDVFEKGRIKEWM